MEKNQIPASAMPDLLDEELLRQAQIDLDDLTPDELNRLLAAADVEGPRQAVEAFLEGDI